MFTEGFACGVSDAVTLDQYFVGPDGTSRCTSYYIVITTTGNEGGIVYENPNKQICWAPYLFTGFNPVAATKILTSATVNGVVRTTTATTLSWYGVYMDN